MEAGLLLEIFIALVHIAHHLLEVALSASHLIMSTTLPHADSTLHIVRGIVIRLDDNEHLLRFLQIETIVERIALRAVTTLKDVVHLAHTYWSHLKRTTVDAIARLHIAPALHHHNGINHRVPIEIGSLG